MKILCLADLHFGLSSDYDIDIDLIAKIQKTIIFHNPDLILIAGDVCEINIENPYFLLSKLSDKPVVFCLGNHEFNHSSVPLVLERYKTLYSPQLYNVHCLDIIGRYSVENINIVGNVFWYDGSLKNTKHQIDDGVVRNWYESSMIDFNYKIEHQKCKEQIYQNISEDKENILLTHCVPHHSLNKHMMCSGVGNMYSGVSDFITCNNFRYAICGHTHLPVTEKIKKTFCVNIGQDYYLYSNKVSYYVLDI